ncbi:class I SAM-dependent methyltransferase [Wukongibacter sp. M2B1]|uniref:class I SAM-dependent methyltransferase n=1 Tax=Wukongibacter sp. M2B1 TaxID=3088895 RepID=UPI003D7B86C7
MNSLINGKALAWDIMGSKYWDSGYNGGPSPRDIQKYLDKIDKNKRVAVIGASTVNLIKAALESDLNITVIDFSEKMCNCLAKELLPQKCNIVHHDITKPVPEFLHNKFDYILADRLINRFTEIEIRKAFKEVLQLLNDNGIFRTSIRLGLYKRDMPFISEGKKRGTLHNFFDEETWIIDYSKCDDILDEFISPHGEISKDTLVEFYRLRGPEKRLRASDIENYVNSIALQDKCLKILSTETLPDVTDDLLYSFQVKNL